MNIQKSINSDFIPVGSDVQLLLTSTNYIVNAGLNPEVIIKFTAPLALDGYISFTVGGRHANIYIGPNLSAETMFPNTSFFSGYGTAFVPATFAETYKMKFERLPFIYKNFDVSIHNIDTSYFELKFKGKTVGEVISVFSDIIDPFVIITSSTNGVAAQFQDNFLFNIDIYTAEYNSNIYFKLVSLYAYPDGGGKATVEINDYLIKKIWYDFIEKSDTFYQLPNALPVAELFSKKVKVKVWETYGIPAEDQRVNEISFYCFSGGLPPHERIVYNNNSLMNKWLTKRPFVRYMSRTGFDFICYLSSNTAPVVPYLLLYSGAILRKKIPAGDAATETFQPMFYPLSYFTLSIADEDYFPEELTHYQVQLINTATNTNVGDPFTVILSDSRDNPGYDTEKYSVQMMYLNSLGMPESIILRAPVEKIISVTGDEIQRKKKYAQLNKEVFGDFINENPVARHLYKASTGFYAGEKEAICIEEFLKSPIHILFVPGGRRFPVNIKRDKFKVSDTLTPGQSVEFEFSIANIQNQYNQW